MRADMKAAHEACKNAPDRHACMTENMCAKQADPAKCKERAKERHARHAKHMDERQAIAEACTGKRGDDLRKCYRDEAQILRHKTLIREVRRSGRFWTPDGIDRQAAVA